jgi:hypothetical protein
MATAVCLLNYHSFWLYHHTIPSTLSDFVFGRSRLPNISKRQTRENMKISFPFIMIQCSTFHFPLNIRILGSRSIRANQHQFPITVMWKSQRRFLIWQKRDINIFYSKMSIIFLSFLPFSLFHENPFCWTHTCTLLLHSWVYIISQFSTLHPDGGRTWWKQH